MTVAFNINEILQDHGYTLIRGMDKGGFSSIFLVRSQRYSKEFVLKCSKIKDPEIDFREVYVMTHLIHPNILQCYDFWDTDNILYQIIDYCPEGNLLDYLRKTPIGMDLKRSIFIQICSGIQHMHKEGYAHNDIKINNILIDIYNRPLIADFGLSSKVNGLSTEYSGTLLCMAPEILKMEPFNPFLADVWSLGILLYVILFQKYPFVGKNQEEMLSAIADFHLEIPDTVPEPFIHALNGMLKVNPNERIALGQVFSLFASPNCRRTRHLTTYCSYDQMESFAGKQFRRKFSNSTNLEKLPQLEPQIISPSSPTQDLFKSKRIIRPRVLIHKASTTRSRSENYGLLH